MSLLFSGHLWGAEAGSADDCAPKRYAPISIVTIGAVLTTLIRAFFMQSP